MNKPIQFDQIPWTSVLVGMKEKVFKLDTGQLRLIRFEKGFVEPDWCSKGHLGYIIDGEMSIDFNGEIVRYKQGDGIYIPEGEATKHKGLIENYVELILFESF